MDGVVGNPEVKLKIERVEQHISGKYPEVNGKRIFNQQRKKEAR